MAKLTVITTPEGKIQMHMEFSQPLPVDDGDVPYEDMLLLECVAGIQEHLKANGFSQTGLEKEL